MRKNRWLLLVISSITALIGLALAILYFSQGQVLLGGLWGLSAGLAVTSGVLNWKLARRG